MVIILRRIPENTQEHEIIDFLEIKLKGKIFQKPGSIESISILALKDIQRNTLEYHGLVTIDSEVAAKRVIKQLSRKHFKNRPIIVREYFHRSWHNDQRVNMRQWNEELANKRKQSRRRAKLEVISKESLKFSKTNTNPRVL